MRPIELEVDHVFQHKHLLLTFAPGTTGIIGRNGSGKSNFLETLYFSMTGKTGSDCTKEDMINWNSKTGHTRYKFEHVGQIFELKRNVHNSSATLSGGSLPKPLKNAEANAFMEDVLGMSFDGLYKTCWTPQGELSSVLTMSHANRVAFFQRLAKTRRAETIRGIIQENGLNKLPTYVDHTEDIL